MVCFWQPQIPIYPIFHFIPSFKISSKALHTTEGQTNRSLFACITYPVPPTLVYLAAWILFPSHMWQQPFLHTYSQYLSCLSLSALHYQNIIFIMLPVWRRCSHGKKQQSCWTLIFLFCQFIELLGITRKYGPRLSWQVDDKLIISNWTRKMVPFPHHWVFWQCCCTSPLCHYAPNSIAHCSKRFNRTCVNW